jgi:hypothetical protein
MMFKPRLVVLLVALGCGGSHPADVDAGSPDAGSPDASWRLADRMPRAIGRDKSAILVHPTIVPITFSDDPNLANINAFYGAYGASTAWSDQVAEYGVGAMTGGTPRDLGPKPQGTSDQEVLALLEANLSGTTPAWGFPDPNTIYAFFIPDGVTFAEEDGAQCCADFDGYHSNATIGTTEIAYSINCACPNEATRFGITLFQDMGTTMGHEAVEAATDPFGDDAAWVGTDDAHAAFTYGNMPGELGDLCDVAATEIWLDDPSGFAVQRTWSNKAAAAGHDPCVGAGTKPYYQTVPDDPDSAVVSFAGEIDEAGGLRWFAKGTRIAVGATGTITMRVLADDPTAGPFNVAIEDLNAFYRRGSPFLTFTAITGTYMPDDVVTTTVTVNGTDPAMRGGETYVVLTTPVSGNGPETVWYALVVQ